MKVTFSRQTLLSGLALTQNTVASSGTLPILSNVLFDVKSGGVDLVATDLECFARVSLDAQVEETGRSTAPARTLMDIVRLLPDDNVAIVTSGSRMTLTCNRNVYHLATMEAEDYPDWPKFEPKVQLTLKQSDLKRLLGNTLFAIPQRDPRKVLMGTLFEIKGGKLTCVATDGRKLGKSITEPVELKGAEKGFQAIVPGRILHEIEKALTDEGEVEFDLSEGRVACRLSNLKLTYLSTLIEGKFPQYDAVIPSSFKKTIELPRASIAEAIDRAAILAERKHHSIVLSFEKNLLQIRAQSFEDGSYEGELEIDFDGEPFKLAFNYHYLNEVLRVASDAKVRMKIKESTAPVVFECESDLDSLYLVMPVRIHEIEEGEAGGDEDEGDDDE